MKPRAWLWWLSVSALIGLTLACNESVTPATISVPAAPVVTSSVLQPTIDALQVERYARAIEAEQQQAAAQATLSVFYAEQTATTESVQATATAQSWAATATTEARQAQTTATAWQTTVEAGQVYATATAQAQAAQATATASAVAAAEVRQQVREATTATTEAILFSQHATETAVAWSAGATATAQALNALATVQAAEARQFELAAQREEQINTVKAWSPLAAALVGCGVLIYAILQMLRTDTVRRRVIPRDARGDAPLVPFQAGPVNGFYDQDRGFGPVIVLKPDGTVEQPGFVDPDYQERVTGRDQLIDLRHRGLPQSVARPGTPQRMSARWPSGTLPPQTRTLPGLSTPRTFRNLRHAVQAGLLPPQFANAIEADWREIQTGDNHEPDADRSQQ